MLALTTLGITPQACKIEHRDKAAGTDQSDQNFVEDPATTGDVPSAIVAFEPPADASVVVAFGPATGLTVDISSVVQVASARLAAGADAMEAAASATRRLEQIVCKSMGQLTGPSTTTSDAAIINSKGRFGALALAEHVTDPLGVAMLVSQTPFLTLVGAHAKAFAQLGSPGEQAPASTAPAAASGLVDASVGSATLLPSDNPPSTAKDNPGSGPMAETTDHVNAWYGVLVRQNQHEFAAAASTRCIAHLPLGSLGAVPVPGAAIHAGPSAAVAAVGPPQLIVQTQAARALYAEIEDGVAVDTLLEEMMERTSQAPGLGVIVVSRDFVRIQTSRRLSWAVLPSPKD